MLLLWIKHFGVEGGGRGWRMGGGKQYMHRRFVLHLYPPLHDWSIEKKINLELFFILGYFLLSIIHLQSSDLSTPECFPNIFHLICVEFKSQSGNTTKDWSVTSIVCNYRIHFFSCEPAPFLQVPLSSNIMNSFCVYLICQAIVNFHQKNHFFFGEKMADQGSQASSSYCQQYHNNRATPSAPKRTKFLEGMFKSITSFLLMVGRIMHNLFFSTYGWRYDSWIEISVLSAKGS